MKTPWHLWIVGILGLLWNAGGAMNYVMTQFRVESYMAQMTEAQRTFFESYPAWVTATWAIAIWGAVLGCLLLLLRSRFATPVFALAFLSMMLTSVHNFLLAEVSMAAIMGPGAATFSAVIVVVAILLWVYANAMNKRGVLR